MGKWFLLCLWLRVRWGEGIDRRRRGCRLGGRWAGCRGVRRDGCSRIGGERVRSGSVSRRLWRYARIYVPFSVLLRRWLRLSVSLLSLQSLSKS